MSDSKDSKLPEFYALEAMKFGGRIQLSGNGKAFTDVDNFNPVALKNLLSDANLGRLCQSLGLDEAKLREAAEVLAAVNYCIENSIGFSPILHMLENKKWEPRVDLFDPKSGETFLTAETLPAAVDALKAERDELRGRVIQLESQLSAEVSNHKDTVAELAEQRRANGELQKLQPAANVEPVLTLKTQVELVDALNRINAQLSELTSKVGNK